MKQISFKSVEAVRLFKREWKRRLGMTFRPRIVAGEAHGYFLRDAIECRVAEEIEKDFPNTVNF